MTSDVTIAHKTSKEEVSRKRLIGFYAAGGLFLLVSLSFFGLMANILAYAFTGWFQAAELGIHQLHEIAGSAFFWSFIVAMIYTVIRPSRSISALRQALAVLAAFVLILLASLSGNLMGPLVMMSLLFVLAVATAALHPVRHEVLRLSGRVQRWLLGLTAVAAVPLLPYALNQLQTQIGASPGDPHAEVGHWTIMSGYALAIVICGVLASLRSAGWRIPAWGAGGLAVLFGLASILMPAQASSVGATWGIGAVIWGALFVAAAEWTAARQSRTAT